MNLEGFLNEGTDGEPRGYGHTLRKAVLALERQHVNFAIAGSLAYSLHVQPTYTQDADLLVEAAQWQEARQALADAGFVIEGDSMLSRATDPKTGIWIDLLFGVGDPEESALDAAKVTSLFKIKAPVIDKDYILWMYLLSDQGRHEDRGIEMLRRGMIDLPWLMSALKYDNDAEALAKLKRWILKSRMPASGWKPRGKRE